MPSKKKLVLWIGIGVVVVVVALGIALTLDYDSPELGRAILSRLGASADLEIEAEGFHLNLLKGVELAGVRVAGQLPAGAVTATADQLVLKHQFWPLLGGKVVVDEIVLERPVVALYSTAEAVPQGAEPAAPPPVEEGASATGEAATSGGGLALNIESFRIVDGSLTLHPPEGADPAETTEVRGLNLELRQLALDPGASSAILGLSASGDIAADEVRTGTTTASDAKGRLVLADGHFRVEDFGLATAPGRVVVGELDVDLTTDPYTYALQAAGDPLNTNLLLGAAKDGGFGAAHLAFEARGDGSETGNLLGGGTLTLDPGKLPLMPILEQLELLFSDTRIIGADYLPSEIRFGLRGDELKIEPFEIVAGQLTLGAFGTVNFATGAMDLHLTVNAPRGELELADVPKEILEALTDAEGRTHLPVLVGGSELSPKVAFDKSQWKALAKKRIESEVRKGVEKELTKALSGLFGGGDEEDP
jgi:hypothetical protein